jgi:23S rRNA (uracil1939-C5)-methyltransferase
MQQLSRDQVIENVLITDIAEEGRGLARVNGLVAFVEEALPGDVVDIRIFKKKSSFIQARVEKYRSRSADRTEPFCRHFGICGGCKWQALSYQAQLKLKQNHVFETLSRLGKISGFNLHSIIPADETRYYRNKLEYTFSHRKWLSPGEFDKNNITDMPALGYHLPRKFDKIFDVEECFLQAGPSNEIRIYLKNYAIENNLEFFDLRNQKGFLRNVIIRSSTTKELMVIVVFYYNDKIEIENLLEALHENFPQITSLQFVINSKRNDTISDLEVVCYKGKKYITEEMPLGVNSVGKLNFKIGPKSFYQTNSKQAFKLYQAARDFAGLTGKEIVYDLYTGTGTIACFVAAKAKKVVGIEYNADAINDAKENAIANNILNTSFYAGDMKVVLNDELIAHEGEPDVIITDPPRAGMHPDVVKKLIEISAPKIVYVSCNPATQARDIELLNIKYNVTDVQPVDMFPHTQHVESIAVLRLR